MLIVTPLAGTWPEPRPQYLITGDRAVNLLDAVSSGALQSAGIKLTTVSAATFTKLTTELVPEVQVGIGSDGKFDPALMPTYLTPGAIADVDIRGVDGKVEEAYLPARLSAAALTALLGGGGGSTTASNTNIAVSGTATIANETVGTSSISTLNATNATVAGGLENGVQTLRQATSPAAPASSKLIQYADTNGRVIWKDAAAVERRASSIRVVTDLPPDSEAYLGDEIIVAATGEHRIYKGVTRGWRLASDHTVFSVEERNALLGKYDGMRVFASFGTKQEHVYYDGKWHGTKTFLVPGGPIWGVSGVNDTNFRNWSGTYFTDPGYEYVIQGSITIEVVTLNNKARVEVWVTAFDSATKANWEQVNIWFEEQTLSFHRGQLAPITGVQSGNRAIEVDWRCIQNNANAYSGNYQAQHSYLVVPA